MKRYFSLLLTVVCCLLMAAPAAAVTLTVGTNSGETGDVLSIPITVDEAGTLAGAAFTLTYSDALTVTVSSEFFDTFFNQFDPLATTGDPIYEGDTVKFPLLDEFGNPVLDDEDNPIFITIPAIVDGVEYDQPLITNPVADGVNRMLISAARCVPGAAGPATLFTLSVSLNPGQPAGVYDLTIIPTVLNNEEAGYDPLGEPIDLLIGSDLNEPVGPSAFPVLLAHTDYLTNVVNGSAEFTEAPAPPENSLFADATVLTGSGGQVTGSNVGASKEDGEPNHAGETGGASVWWTWTATASGQVTIDTFGSNFDTLLAVYTGTMGSLLEIASNDNAGGGFQSQVLFDAVAGTTYYIAVDGFEGATGDIVLNWLPPVVAGDSPRMIAWNPGLVELLVADFGDQGLWTVGEAGVWQQLHAEGNIHRMLVWDGKLVVDFGAGRGMQYHNEFGWFNMTAWDTSNNMLAWNNGSTEVLVVDFGAGRGMWAYNGGWTWMTGWDDTNALAVWNQLLVVDFGAGRGMWTRDTSWHWMTNWDTVNNMIPWFNGTDEVLVVDFGTGRYMWTYDGAWSWMTNLADANLMTVWDNMLVVDFGAGRYMWSRDTAWHWITNNDTAIDMITWDNGSEELLVVDFGTGRSLWTYNGDAWTWLNNNETVEMCQWIDRLAVDFGAGKGIYYRSDAWYWLDDRSTAD